MSTRQATGHVEVRKLARGDVFYAKGRLGDGTEFRKSLGKVWTKRSQPAPGYLTRAQAEARLTAILAGDDPLVNIAPSHVTFGQACAERIRYLRDDRQRRPSTLTDYQNVIDHDLIPYFGESTPVENITTIDIEAFKDVLLARVSHRTAQKVLAILHGILSRAKRKGWIDRNPALDAEKVTVRRSDDFTVLSVEEVEAVARAAESDQLASLIRVAAYTGLRMGELLGLRWARVDFAGRVLRVERNYVNGEEGPPKSHRKRSVPLSDQAMGALDAMSRRKDFTSAGDLVFCNELGEHLVDDKIRRRFYKALTAAGLDDLREQGMTFHDLRHTFGTLCAGARIELPRIQSWMGHADIQTTMRYLHHVPQHDDADRLTAAFKLGPQLGPELPTQGATSSTKEHPNRP
jgi:integrase